MQGIAFIFEFLSYHKNLAMNKKCCSYIDTVGIADSYRKKLEFVFRGKDITFIVEKKADAKYAPCSAASVGKLLALFGCICFLCVHDMSNTCLQ